MWIYTNIIRKLCGYKKTLRNILSVLLMCVLSKGTFTTLLALLECGPSHIQAYMLLVILRYHCMTVNP